MPPPPWTKRLLLILFALFAAASGTFAATLGNSSEGTFTDTIWDAVPYINAFRVQATSTLTVDKMFAKVKATPGRFKVAIYNDTSGNASTLLRESAEVVSPAEGWNAFALASPFTLTSGSWYWFAIWSDSASAEVYASTGGTLRWVARSYGQWPSPISLGGGGAATYCIYAQSQSASGAAIGVRGNNVEIADGDTTPTSTDGTDFGSVDVASGVQSRTFTIYNSGTGALSLTGSPLVAVSGVNAGDFTVVQQPAASVPGSGGSTTFTVTFDPSASGPRSATLTIANSADAANAFDFAISGTGAVLDTTPQSLFPASKTGNDSGAEGNYYELGTIFRSNLAGTITHLRVFALASESGAHTARIWRNSDGAVLGGPYPWTYGGTTGWITLDIPDLPIEADTDYTVSVSTGGGGRNYPFLSGDLASAGGNGINLTRPSNAGVFTTTPGARPTQVFQGSNYLRDVVFVAAQTDPPVEGPVRITEFVADNKSGLQDEDGEFSDWIELYNPTAHPINLAGYQLLDSSATWTFPSVTLASQRYLVVFASGKNRTAVPGTLHTNFKLDAAGESLALKDPSGAVIADFAPAFPAQRSDISYGRRNDGTLAYFLTPTPGSTNGFSFLGFVADTTFSVKRGFFSTPQTVAIACATSGAQIRYTLDGSTPTETHGTIYTTPLTISSTTTLRARAFLTDYLASNIDTQTYLFLNDVLAQSQASAVAYGWPAGPVNGQEFRHGMKPALTSQYTNAQMIAALQQVPSMSIVTDQTNLTDPSTGIYVNPSGDGATWERPVSLELINPDGSTGFQQDCGLRIRGGQSRSTAFPKHSFHINFRSKYGAGKLKFPLFGSGAANEFDTVDLRCEHGYAYADPYSSNAERQEFTAVRDIFCRDLSGASGAATTRSRYYHLYLNGQYWGLYQTQERPQEDYAATYLGGTKDEYDVIKATGLPQLTIENSAGNFDAWTALWTGCRAVAANPTNANYFALLGRNADGTANPALPVLLDPRGLANYMLLHYYTQHADEPLSVSFNWEKPNNFRALRRRGMTDPFHFFVHDGESSMLAPEAYDNRANAVNLTSSLRNDFNYSNPEWMHEDLLANAEYRIAFADEAQRLLFNGGAFTAAAAQPIWDSRASEINQAVIGESIRWGSDPSHNQATWNAKIANVRSQFFPTRTATVIAQLRQSGHRGFALFPSVNAPTFSQRGGRVNSGYALTLSAPAQTGTIYFTTDGTDPRAIGGGIAGTAYSGPISITGQMTVKARFRSSAGEWSALDVASFSTFPAATAANLVLTKIHYNPGAPSAAEIAAGYTDNNDFEYLELQNIGAETIDLRGVKVTVGVAFDFATASIGTLAPGARCVLVKRLASFQFRHGTAAVVAGEYAGNLSNSGEALRIVDGSGADIANFSYDDDPPWPKPPDGSGPALVLIGTNLNPALSTSWRASYSTGGNPGGNDVLTVADWRTQTFSTEELADPAKQATIWGLAADPDGDGFSNLLELALGSGAKDTTSRPPIATELFTEPASGLHYLRLTYRIREGTTGIAITPQCSSDLATWSNSVSLVTGPTSQGDGTALITVQDTTARENAATPRRFMRLQITAP